jgi:hypothetical protein
MSFRSRVAAYGVYRGEFDSRRADSRVASTLRAPPEAPATTTNQQLRVARDRLPQTQNRLFNDQQLSSVPASAVPSFTSHPPFIGEVALRPLVFPGGGRGYAACGGKS